MLAKKLVAEFIGTAWLVLGGCGSAVLAAAFMGGPPVNFPLGIGLTGVSFAFGLTLLTMVYTIGPISGCHINPAVSIGLWAGGRFSTAELIPYIIAQVLGGIAGAAIIYAIVTGKASFSGIGDFAANGYGEHSPGKYNMQAALICEVVMTYVFLLIIMGATDARAPAGFAGLAIGLALTLIHLISVPVTNASVNPARSTSQAIFVGGWALQQLWLFWVGPILGALLAGGTYRWLFSKEEY